MKSFPRAAFGDKPDYSGYAVDEWEKRTGENHKHYAELARDAATQAERESLQRTWGVRYSELHSLPYYDPVRMHVVDPMHNLFLGTAKRVFKVWIETGILSPEKLKHIDSKMKNIKLPADIGRIPSNISTAHSRMTADEWKKWTLVYLLYCLFDVVPGPHYNMWRAFVAACNAMCTAVITGRKIEEAHHCLLLFCRQFEQLCGKEFTTPNMHLHLHLRQCLFDFGPVHAFWCFGFERLNGILSSCPTNNRDMSIQLMKKFSDLNRMYSIDYKHFPEQSKLLGIDIDSEASDSNNHFEEVLDLRIMQQARNISMNDLKMKSLQVLSVPKKVGLFNEDFDNIKKLLERLNPEEKLIAISSFVKGFNRISLGNEIFATESYRNGQSRCMFVLARFLGADINLHDLIIRPAILKAIYSLVVQFEANGILKDDSIVIAELLWLRQHPYKDHFGLASPLKIWDTEFEPYSASSFIPIEFLTGRFCCTKEKIRFGHHGSDVVNIVFPLPLTSTS